MERGYTVKDAAKRLGVSEKTLRKRIKDGNVRADLMNGPRGPQYTVWLTVEEGEGEGWHHGSVEPPPETLPAPIDPRLAPLLALPDQIAEVTRSLDRVEGTIKDDRDALAAKLESVLLCVQQSTETVARLERELAEARKPWWRKMWRR